MPGEFLSRLLFTFYQYPTVRRCRFHYQRRVTPRRQCEVDRDGLPTGEVFIGGWRPDHHVGGRKPDAAFTFGKIDTL